MTKQRRRYTYSPQSNPYWLGHQIHGHYVFPLDNLLMMLYSALSPLSGIAPVLELTEVELKKILMAQKDKEIDLYLEIDATKQCCAMQQIHGNGDKELVLECAYQFHFQKENSRLWTPERDLFRDDFYPQDSLHHLGDCYRIIEQYNLVNGSLHAALNADAHLPAVLGSMLHALIYLHDPSFAKNPRPSLPQSIKRISFNLVNQQPRVFLKALGATAEVFCGEGIWQIMLEGLQFSEHERVRSTPIKEALDIAVIGMAGTFPQAETINVLWQSLGAGFDAIRPLEKRGLSELREPNHAGWLDDVFSFDSDYFHIPKIEAQAMDPQQRLFLQTAASALVDAGYEPMHLADRSCGVFVGASQNNYLTHSLQKPIAQSFWGNAPSVIAGRVAYTFNLTGPAITIDTACSSSLVALHQACQAIKNGECATALAGGVFIMTSDDFLQQAHHAKMLSPDHACHTFSDKANGFIPGEAVACVYLKPLAQALQDQDEIYAVIKASGVNQDGQSNGITAPNGLAQTELMQHIYTSYGLSTADLAYIETHGTGTELGDPIEVHALQRLFASHEVSKQSCGLGSIKSNIGHTVHAAGITGFIKCVLSAYFQKIPANIHYERENPQIDFASTPFYPVTELSVWPEDKSLAAVSSFGFSGTNAHVVIQRFASQKQHSFSVPPFKKIPCYWQVPHEYALSAQQTYFSQHQVHQQAILPAVVSVALMQHLLQQVPLYAENVRWLHALPALNPKLAVQIHQRQDVVELLHAGTPFFSAELTKNKHLLPVLDLSDFKCISKSIDCAEFYNSFVQAGIDYGSDLQNISQLFADEDRVFAVLHFKDDFDEFLFNPYLLDAALQTVGYFTLFQKQPLSLPVSARKIALLKKVPKRALVCTQKISALSFTIQIFDPEGNLCVCIEELNAQIVRSLGDAQRNPGLESIATQVYSIFANRLNMSVAELEKIKQFSKLGLDSLLSMDIIFDLEIYFGKQAKTLLFEHTNFDELIAHFSSQSEINPPAVFSEPKTDISDMAIIGMAIHFPQAADFHSFIDVLDQGKNCVQTIEGHSYNYGALLEDANDFDALFFNIAPHDALIMCPQERVMLQNAWHCFEDAGISLDEQARSVAVFIGAMNNFYQLTGFEKSIEEQKTIVANSTAASIANRISSVLNLTGPSLTLDSMCSSSLTALHLAIQAIRANDASMALVGGVNLISHDYKYQELLQRNMLSLKGHCASFGEQADGYVPSEGVVSILIKPLKAAIQEGHRIHAVIKGTSITHNGASSGYTVPNVNAQAEVIKKALANASLQADDLGYLECHGTGTQLGDPIEIKGLAKIFSQCSTPCFIGSLKSNYGHMEAAAGLAGVVKVIAQMQQKKLYASLHANSLNTNIQLPASLLLCQTQMPWSPHLQDHCYYAGVSSFGAGGSNAHVILQSYEQTIKPKLNPLPRTVFQGRRYFHDIESKAAAKKLYHYDWQYQEISLSAGPKRQWIVLSMESNYEAMQAYLPPNALQLVYSSRQGWYQAKEGNLVTQKQILELLTPDFVLLDCCTQEFNLIDHLTLLQQIASTAKKGIILQINEELSPDLAVVSYFLHCMNQQTMGLKTATLEIEDKHVLNKELIQHELNQIKVHYQKIRYQQGQRFIQVLQEKEFNNASAAAIESEKVYLITGGTSGIGAELAKWLVAQGVRKLILTGISPLPQESLWSHYMHSPCKAGKTIQLISQLKKQGCAVYYYIGDLAQEELFAAFLKIVMREQERFAWVFHCAGVTPQQTKELAALTRNDFEQMLHPKRTSLNAVWPVINAYGFDQLALFSSVSSVLPELATGVLDYAVSNHYLNAFAQAHAGKVLSLVWPVWSDFSKNAELTSSYQRTKLGSYKTEEALALLSSLLGTALAAPIIMPSQNKLDLHLPEQTSPLQRSVLDTLKVILIEVIGVNETEIELERTFNEYGVDSVLLMALLKKVETVMGLVLTAEVILENNTLARLSSYIQKTKVLTQEPVVAQPVFAPTQKIAVIGMACQFPEAENLDQFWNNLRQGIIALKPIPQSRIDNKEYAQVRGGFIQDDEAEQALEFGFSAKYQEQINPLITRALTLSHQAIFDAGFTRETIKGMNVGVFVGTRADTQCQKDINNFTIIGQGQNFIAAHINHFFDLTGTAEVVDTACSSSLVALNHALYALKSGDIDLALVGGIDGLTNTRPFALMDAAKALSPDFRCRPFDVQANGIVLSEGGGFIVLKALEQARADGNKIYTVIEGIAVNNDGNTMGYTTPNPKAQQNVIQKALANAGLKAEQLEYVEMHATGTELGDPMELQALTRVLGSRTQKKCVVGGVKANIGHTLSAAGMAGFIKTALCSYHHCLLPQPEKVTPNPRYDFANSPLRLLDEVHFLETKQTHYFGVSAFGFGGTNAHVILSNHNNQGSLGEAQRNPGSVVAQTTIPQLHVMDDFFDVERI